MAGLLFVVSCLGAAILTASGNPIGEDPKPTDRMTGVRHPVSKHRSVAEACKTFVELESTDFLRLAYSANGTILELGRAQTFLVIRCLAQGDSCATNIDSSKHSSRCETVMGVRKALARRHEIDEDFAMWDILLPAACGCSINRKGEQAATIQIV